MRLDKWLWVARFFKTRSLASTAVDGGKVHLNGSRAKPARDVKPGDTLDIQGEEVRWQVVVRGMNGQRRPAAEAQLLYEETPESQAARAQVRERQKFAAEPAADRQGRPTKRDRRRLDGLG